MLHIALKIKTKGLNKLSPFYHDSGVYAVGIAYEKRMATMREDPIAHECFMSTQFVSERDMLEALFKKLNDTFPVVDSINWLTWNGKRFDIPYLLHRCLINGMDANQVFKWFPQFSSFLPFQKWKDTGPKISELKPVFIPEDPDAGCNSLSNVAKAYGIEIEESDKAFITNEMLADREWQKNFNSQPIDAAMCALKYEVKSIYKLGGFAV